MRRAVPRWASTRRPGAKRVNLCCQSPTTDGGQISSAGLRSGIIDRWEDVRGLAELARRLGISHTFLNDKLKGRWGYFAGPKLLDALGLEGRYVSKKKQSKK